MASLTVRTPDGKTRVVNLLKRLTSVGRGPDNDVRLEDPAAPESAFHILFDGSRYQVGSHGGPVQINGRKKDEHLLAAQDVIRIGDTELSFALGADPAAPPAITPTRAREATNPDSHTTELPGVPGRELAMLERLTAFSEKVFGVWNVQTLLETLMDEAIDLTRANKGFLILVENNDPRIKVARNVSRETIEDAHERVSDSIVQEVVRTGSALIVADALADPKFKASESVVNLKLLSVMCAPLKHKGDLFGLLYVGNDRLVNRFEPKSLDLLNIFAAQASLILQNAMLVNDLFLTNSELKNRLESAKFGEIIGACSGMLDVYRRIEKIAQTDISVLITGETGTGKELIAREIHLRSPRAKGPFVVINCGAIPENLLESELFGHVKGAFTGAVVTKSGKFQAAIGGTLFLDEIGEMPLQLQVKLLRALQEKVVNKVGDNRAEPVDIRVVTATNRVLEEEVKKGTFREDLYYRLNVVNIRLPPLREREGDLEMLGRFFIQKYAREFSGKARSFSPSALVAMKKYAWPGNVRELENRIKKAVVLTEKAVLAADDLDLKPHDLQPILPLAEAKEQFQKDYINKVLERNGGNRTKTAKDLGVDPRTIFRHLEKLEAEKNGRKLPPDDDELNEAR
jgi:transcriptional regulator with GAF, ATPase, and Fis domain